LHKTIVTRQFFILLKYPAHKLLADTAEIAAVAALYHWLSNTFDNHII